MSFFEWEDSFNVGIELADNQHRKIADYINELDTLERSKNNSAINYQAELEKVIDQLVDYTITHFVDEEEMLRKAFYSQLSIHSKIHAIFTNRIKKYKDRVRNNEDIASEVKNGLKTWLIDHIKREDQEYARVLLNKK